MEKGALRVAKVQGIYFIYPPHLSLNQEEFLAVVLVKARGYRTGLLCRKKWGFVFLYTGKCR
ncbi:hypothetical protein SRRS_16250 [Sporomusa rhizae]|uniref:hypothetical protein n=1 Tax=Sporomusa rhizae TaxID=357999 RepID=UPI00352A5CD6